MEQQHGVGSHTCPWSDPPIPLPLLLWAVFRSCLPAGLSQPSREHHRGLLGQCNRRQPSLRSHPSPAGAIQGEWVPCQLPKSGSSSGTPHETQDNPPSSCQPPQSSRAAQAPPGSPHPLPGALLSAAGPVMLKLSQRFLCSSQAFLLPNTHGQTFQRIIGKTRTFPFAKNCCSRAVLPRGGPAPGSPSVRQGDSTGQPGRGSG